MLDLSQASGPGSSCSKVSGAVAPPDRVGGCGRAGTGAPEVPGSPAEPDSTGRASWVQASAIGSPRWIHRSNGPPTYLNASPHLAHTMSPGTQTTATYRSWFSPQAA